MIDLKIDEILQKAENEQIENAAYRKSFILDPDEEIQPPQTAWGLINASNDEVSILGTLGNFSLIIGKAKAKKSFFINIAVSCALSNIPVLNRFVSNLPDNQKEVLYFDTEQGSYHCQLALKRICKQLDVKRPKNLSLYHLRSLTPAQRLKLIEEEIYSNDKIGLVVIDGIVDLITAINDEEQASYIASKLLKWTEERNIHIITVLHQNKGDQNARGHVGSSLTHKSEAVLSITREESNPDISTMKAEFCRNREPEPFSFEIDTDGLPIEVVGFEPKARKEKNFNINQIENYKLYQLLTESFNNETEINYSELVRKVKIAYSNQITGTIGDNKAKDIISKCKINNWLTQSDKKYNPYLLLPFEPV